LLNSGIGDTAVAEPPFRFVVHPLVELFAEGGVIPDVEFLTRVRAQVCEVEHELVVVLQSVHEDAGVEALLLHEPHHEA
jgi:hypothetical protein